MSYNQQGREMNELKIKDFKYSYNRLHNIYRVQLFEYGKWRKCTYDKKNFEFIVNNNLKTRSEIRNFSYSPYLFYIIKWSSIKLWKWIEKKEPKVKKIRENAIIGIVFLILGYLINNRESTYKTFFQTSSTPNNEQEIKIKDQTIQNYKAFSDSLLKEIEKKEVIIKEYELAHPKDSILKNKNDSLKIEKKT